MTGIKGLDNTLKTKLLALSKWFSVTEKDKIKSEYERYSDDDNFEKLYSLISYKHPDTLIRVAHVPLYDIIILVDNITTCIADTEDIAMNDEIETLYEIYE